MSNPLAMGIGGVGATGALGLGVATAGTAEMSAAYLIHRDEILDAYAQGMTKRSELYGDGSVVTAKDITDDKMVIDAFRHSYSSGYLKMNFGEEIASSFDLWELAGPIVHAPKNAFHVASRGGDMEEITQALFHPKPSGSQMDYWNNAIMRHEDVTPETIIPIILEKMRTNELVLDQHDPRLAEYEGPGLPSAILAKNFVYDEVPAPEDYFGFTDAADVPAIGQSEEELAVSVQWSYEQLLEQDESLVLSGNSRTDVEALHNAAVDNEPMQRYLEHIDYQLAVNEAASGQQDVKPVIGNVPDIPSTLSSDDVLLNPSSAPALVANGIAIGK